MVGPQGLENLRNELLRISSDPHADLAEGALWISMLENPDVVVPKYLQWLANAATEAQSNAGRLDPPTLLAVLRHDLGFRGDEDNYYDARNSCLDQVIERRLGIPITLSLIYISLAARAGEVATGINAPGHFLVRHGDMVVDPFQGELMSSAAFANHLSKLGLPKPRTQAERLLREPPDHRSILVRMLINLRGIYLRATNYEKSLSVADLLTNLDPDNPAWLRDRGLLYRQLDCPEQSQADLKAYILASPQSPDLESIRELIASMAEKPRTLH